MDSNEDRKPAAVDAPEGEPVPADSDDGVAALAANDEIEVAPAVHVARGQAVGAQAVGASSIGAVALGALALGAVAIGALAIGRLAIGRFAIGEGRIDRLRIGTLEIGEVKDLVDDERL